MMDFNYTVKVYCDAIEDGGEHTARVSKSR